MSFARWVVRACAVWVAFAATTAHAQGLDAGLASVAPEADAASPLEDASDAGSPLDLDALDAGAPPLDVAPRSLDVAGPPAVDVTVRARSVRDRMQASSEAVSVLDLSSQRRQSADLGEVLARTEGVGVRRQGGLGSGERITLNGLGNDQVRVFVDGLPIEYTGFGAGVSNLPLNLIERIEIYRGVVPARFGSDALGGALNVVLKTPTRGAGGNASLQVGSFGTQRLTAGVHHLHAPTGLVTNANVFFDDAKNDYAVHVGVPQPTGGTNFTDVYRRHDAYRAYGGGVDLGFVRRPWAERLMLKLFASSYDKQIPHNVVMTVPYGEARYGGQNAGANLTYEQSLGEQLHIEAVLGYGLQVTDFVDVGEWLYDWFGQRRTMLSHRGEIEGKYGQSYDQTMIQHGVFGRVHATYRPTELQTLRLTVAPSHTRRTGDNREQDLLDPLEADARLSTVVTGIEHVLSAFGERIENTLFGKSYYYRARMNEPLQSGFWRDRSRTDPYFGAGDALRIRLSDDVSVKASYEYAARLPRPDEVFGDGALVAANLGLAPERSHNANLSVVIERSDDALGRLRLELNGLTRNADDLIFLRGGAERKMYVNLGTARGFGVQASGSYASRRDYLGLDANFTYQDLRNQSSKGSDASFKGDRVPNLPYLFANAAARGSLPGVLVDTDSLSLTYYLRYVHSFYRGYESAGFTNFKQSVDSQLSHSLSLGYVVKRGKHSVSAALDAQNISNARLYDVFGAQRPGRGYYTKLTAEF